MRLNESRGNSTTVKSDAEEEKKRFRKVGCVMRAHPISGTFSRPGLNPFKLAQA